MAAKPAAVPRAVNRRRAPGSRCITAKAKPDAAKLSHFPSFFCKTKNDLKPRQRQHPWWRPKARYEAKNNKLPLIRGLAGSDIATAPRSRREGLPNRDVKRSRTRTLHRSHLKC